MASRISTLILTTLAATAVSLVTSLSISPVPHHDNINNNIRTSQNDCVDPAKCTCAEMSLSSANWTAIDFHYYSSSDAAQKLSITSVDFSVVNIAIKNVTHCSVRTGKGRRSLDGGAEWYQCDPSTRSPVTFRFNPTSGLLELNQDWVCDREAPSRVWVTGNVTVPMQCKDTSAGHSKTPPSRRDASKRGFGMARDQGVLCDMANFTVPWLEIAASG